MPSRSLWSELHPRERLILAMTALIAEKTGLESVRFNKVRRATEIPIEIFEQDLDRLVFWNFIVVDEETKKIHITARAKKMQPELRTRTQHKYTYRNRSGTS